MSRDARRAQIGTAVRVAAATAAGGEALERELDTAARRCEEGAVDPAAVEEVLLQAHLFLGFPASLEGLARWRELGMPAAGDHGDAPPPEQRAERGRRLCRRVYGASYESLRTNVRELHPALDRWMVERGYGEVLSRPGLPVEVRELCVVATLAVAARPRQLHAHLHGALNVGATEGEVARALSLAEEVAGTGLVGPRELWSRVRTGSGG